MSDDNRPANIAKLQDALTRAAEARGDRLSSPKLQPIMIEMLGVLGHPEAYVSDRVEIAFCRCSGHDRTIQAAAIRKHFAVDCEPDELFADVAARIYQSRKSAGLVS